MTSLTGCRASGRVYTMQENLTLSQWVKGPGQGGTWQQAGSTTLPTQCSVLQVSRDGRWLFAGLLDGTVMGIETDCIGEWECGLHARPYLEELAPSQPIRVC